MVYLGYTSLAGTLSLQFQVVTFWWNNLYSRNIMNKKQAILKKIKRKLEKASKAHAGQAKAIGKVLKNKKKK